MASSMKFVLVATAASVFVVGFAFQALSPKLVEKRTRTLNNLKQVGMAVLMYSADFDDVTPPFKTMAKTEEAVYPYTKNRSIFKTLNPAGGKLLLNPSTVQVRITSIDRPSETPMVYESKPWSDGKRVVAYWDGHTKAADAAAWKRAQPYLKLKLVKVGGSASKRKPGK